jgi:hypothetical protein
MARVRICSACGHRNPPQEMFCEGPCGGTSLANVPSTELGEGLAAAAPGTSQASRAPHVSNPADPPAPATAPAPATVRERETVARLVFPWGEEQVRGTLAVGRDPAYSPLARRLQAYPSVSSRHAELRSTRDGFAVRHVGSTNPTYIDGRALASGETAIAGDGAEIAFSRALTARLHVER